jgi:polysaccharide pyruvyl transferase WcaK-like protein
MVSKPKLGVVGYYHYGNYGDELFLDVFRQHLGDFEFVFFQDMLNRPYFRTPLEEKVRSVDAILIGGGDLVIPNYWSDQYFEPQYLEKPVYIHGVGVPTWGGEDAKVVERLAGFLQHENVRHIHVRDEQSRSWIKTKLAPAIDPQVTPDIVCALDLPEVARADGTPIFGLISRKQNPGSINWKNIHALCARAKSYGYRLRHIILATGMIGKEDREAVAESALHDVEVIMSESIADLTRAIGECAVVASMKFHGCVVATMYGTPAITLITTDKFRNFYKLIERDELVAHHRHDTLPDRLPKYVTKIPDLTRKDVGNQARQGLSALGELMRKDLRIH